MKRQHWPSRADDAEEDSRPAKVSRTREEEQLTAGDFDLNATPRGFDLNAPVPEEEYGHGSDWMAVEPEETANRVSPLASSDNLQQKERECSTAIFQQDLEPAASLGIDEDLDILHSIWNAWSQEDSERLDHILASLCDEIGKHPFAPPRYQYLTCFYLSKKLPGAFSLPRTYKVLLAFLNPSGPGSLTKKQNLLPVFACRLLFRAFSEESEWPMDFITVYLEDAVSSRNWVDNEFCKEFVVNVLTAFRDDDQDISLGSDDLQGYSADVNTSKSDSSSTNQQGTIAVRNRYPKDDIRQKARMEFLEALNQLLKVPSIKDSPRPLLRLFMLGVCYEETRVLASSMLEIWLNNPVHFRAAKVLLDCIIHNTHGTTVNDFDTVSNLIALRLSSQGAAQMKTSLSNIYTDIVFQLVQRRSEYSLLALKTFLTAELNVKASHNTKGILVVFKALPDSLSPEREFALAIKELAVNEEYGVRLQDAVGRLTKQLSREISPFLLARALLEPWPSIQEQHESARQAWLKEIIGLVCHLLIQAGAALASDENLILAISSTAEQFQNELPKDKQSELEAFSMKVMTFQVEALTWCTDVLNAYLPRMDSNQFCSSVRKLLFLEPLQEYSLSSTSGDVELNSFQVVAFSMHASEEILARVILMGISNQFPMLQGDALCIIESLVWRAASLNKHKFEILFADNNQLPAAIMKLSSLNFPGLTRQPLPQFVLRDMYWRSCLVILPIAVYNPTTIGKNVWENIPAIRCLLECLVTESTALRQHESTNLEEAEGDIKAEEAIEEFLAEEPESNDGAKGASERWKGNVMLLSHSSYVRKPPRYVLEELDQIDKLYHLGRTLRTWKNPNFVGDTVSSQEFRQAWTWVKKVMEKEPEIVRMLPCAWQCELLYMHERSKIRGQDMFLWMQELCGNIYERIAGETSSTENEVIAVIKFLAGKLTSQICAVRSCARSCFSGILGCASFSGSRSAMDADTPDRDGYRLRPFPYEDDCTWLEAIEKLQTASIILKLLAPTVREALLHETSIRVIWSYLLFLKKHVSSLSLAYSIARLIMHRKIIAASLLSMPSKDTYLVASDKDESLPVTELVLESFSKALHLCTQAVSSEWEGVDSPFLKLVSPQYVGGRNNVATVSVNIPGVVLEAMVEILGFIGSSGNETYKNNASYCHLLQFLFPGYTSSDRIQKNDDGDLMIAFIELEFGERSLFLSKDQANGLAQSRDSRLVKAGFSILGLDAKLKLLKELGLSTEAKSYLLEELEAVSDASLQNLLPPLSNWQHLYLRSCFSTLTESEQTHFARILCNLKGNASVAPLQKHQSVSVRSRHQMRGLLHEKSCEHLVKSTVQGLLYRMDEANLGHGSAEVEPDIIQEYFSFRILLQKAALGVDENRIFECVHNTLDMISVKGGDVHLKASLVLPVFTLLFEASLRGSNNSNLLVKILPRIKSGIKQEPRGALIFAAVNKRLELLEKELAEKLKYTSDVLHVDAGRGYAGSYEGISNSVPLEQSLREFLHMRLVEYWKGGRTSSDDQPFVSLVQCVLSSFRLQNVAVSNSDIEIAGRNGLLVGFVSFLDPDIAYRDQYLPLVCTFESLANVESNFTLEKGNELLFTDLLLQYVIQNCRQQSVAGLQHDLWAKISKSFSGKRFEQVNKLRESFDGKLCLAATVMLEFLSASWNNDLCKNVGRCVSIMTINHLALGGLVQDSVTNLGSSSSARALTSLAVISCALPEHFWGTVDWNDHMSMALKSVLRAASGRHVMPAIIQQLVSMARNNECVIAKKPHVTTDGLIQRAAAGLLCGLYMAYPVTVGNILVSSTGSSTLLSCFWKALSTSQTSSLHSIVRGAIESVFSSRSNMGAYGLCYNMARKHPAFLIPHISTLRLLLQEFVMPMKRGNPELWASNANLLVFTIELLDALRPCLLYDGSCSSTLTTQRSFAPQYDDLESLLVLYFQVIEDLDASDQPFGKFIAQLADFLCHCLAAGGKFAKFIYSHKQGLQLAFEKFGKTKKISHLLHLLEKGSSLVSTSTVFDDLDETAVDQIEKVKKLLSRFLSFQKTHPLQESWNIMGLGDYKVDDESGLNLLSTVTDLERASAHLPGILANMEDSLVELLKMDDLDISERAYVLIRRFLQHNSSNSAGTVAYAIVQQLTTSKTAHVEAAARHVGKLFYYCEELQESILMELFRGGKIVSGSLHQILSEALSMSRNNVSL